MKKVIISFLILFLAVSVSAGQVDSSRFAALRQKLAGYYDAIRHESLAVQKEECDFLIESTNDSTLRDFVAQDIYRHYLTSPVMGTENIAVHVYDRWIATGKVRMKSDQDKLAAGIHAEFNRMSLIGEPAPELSLESSDGRFVELFKGPDSTGRYTILYFYDTDCSRCKAETVLLRNLLLSSDYPVRLYAVYVGDDREEWDRYRAERFGERLKALHLWDPSLESDFQRKYGVIQTPGMFLVAPDGKILGRRLDVKALETMLDGLSQTRQLDYGTDEAFRLYSGIFASSHGRPSSGEVKGIADYIHDRTLATGDTLMFRQMAGDYLYYLSTQSGEGVKEGLKYHIDTNILSSDVWKSEDDSLKIVGFAKIMSDLLSKAVPGTRVPSLKVPGELYTWKGSRNVSLRLDRLKGRENIIIFYTEGCEVCAAQKKAVLELLSAAGDRSEPSVDRKSARRMRVFMVNLDRLMGADPALASSLMDAFDLSSLPFILMTDPKGVVLRRYVLF